MCSPSNTRDPRNEPDLTTPPTTEEPPTLEPPAPDTAAPETAHSVKTRAISGVKVLAARTLVSVLLRVVSSLSLAHLLFPKDYGLFGVAASLTGLGMMLSDVGLGGALIRQNEKPTANETFTVFWTQQAMTAVLVLGIIAASPWLAHAYHLSSAAALLLSAMAVGLFFSSLRVVPMMALERDLSYPAIARCELIENLVQTGSTIVLALLGCGAWSLAGGGLLRGIVGLACVWAASPWRPHGRFEFAIVRRLAKFGIPFQLNALAPSLLGGWMPLVVSRILGVAAVGLVGWAVNISYVPMMLAGVLSRVAFPAYSRLQSDPGSLAVYLSTSVRRLNALLCLGIPVFVIICPAVIPLIFGHRWIPAIILVQWFSLESIILIILGLVASAQNAIGYPGDRLAITIVMGMVRWLVGFLVVKHYGLFGLGPAMFVVSSVDMTVTIFLLKYRFSHCGALFSEVFRPLASMLFVLALSLGVGYGMNHKNTVLETAISLTVFAMITFICELLSVERPMTKEFKNIVRMLKPAHN